MITAGLLAKTATDCKLKIRRWNLDRLGVGHRFCQVGGGILPLWETNITIWVNYNKLTTSSLEIIVSKGNHPQMALIQVSELL